MAPTAVDATSKSKNGATAIKNAALVTDAVEETVNVAAAAAAVEIAGVVVVDDDSIAKSAMDAAEILAPVFVQFPAPVAML